MNDVQFWRCINEVIINLGVGKFLHNLALWIIFFKQANSSWEVNMNRYTIVSYKLKKDLEVTKTKTQRLSMSGMCLDKFSIYRKSRWEWSPPDFMILLKSFLITRIAFDIYHTLHLLNLPKEWIEGRQNWYNSAGPLALVRHWTRALNENLHACCEFPYEP